LFPCEADEIVAKFKALDLSVAADLEDASEWTMRQRIDNGEYESYLDGNKRKITLRSIIERRKRLLEAQTPSPTIPPKDAWVKSAKVRARRRRLAAVDNRKPPSPNAPRRGRPRKPETTATTTVTP
jgi:hypothetical protein